MVSNHVVVIYTDLFFSVSKNSLHQERTDFFLKEYYKETDEVFGCNYIKTDI